MTCSDRTRDMWEQEYHAWVRLKDPTCNLFYIVVYIFEYMSHKGKGRAVVRQSEDTINSCCVTAKQVRMFDHNRR